MAENWKHLYQQMKKMVALYQDEVVPGLREVIDRQDRKLMHERNVEQWIPVHKEKPKRAEHKWVLVRSDKSEPTGCLYHVAKLKNGVWHDADGLPIEDLRGITITHWLPIPKEESE